MAHAAHPRKLHVEVEIRGHVRAHVAHVEYDAKLNRSYKTY